MIKEIPTMLTIKETAEKTGLAEYYIRQCCINNKIVHVRCGKRILVNLDKFVDFLNTSTGEAEVNPEMHGKIRRLSEKI